MSMAPEDKIIAINVAVVVVYVLCAWLLPPWGLFLLMVVGGPVALYFCIKFFAEGVKRRLNDKEQG